MSVFIIAEAGVNHNGSINLAKKMIDIASYAGADAIKFQTFKTINIATKNLDKADYQKNKNNKNENQFDMLKKLELSKEDHNKLIKYCKLKKIKFLSSPFDIESLDLLKDLGLEIFKVPSGEITNLPFLKHLGNLNKKIILSTGMSYMNEVKTAFKTLIQSGTLKKNITILHSNTQYPTPMKDVNLNAMVRIGEELGVKYGYSDHTLGIEVDVAAVAMGASCVEKHFTLDKNMEGPDHKASLEPIELEKMIKSIRNVEMALGSKIKQPTKGELSNIKKVRKSIVAKTLIKKGDIFSEKNLAIKRPGNGTSPVKWEELIGKKARKNYKQDDLI